MAEVKDAKSWGNGYFRISLMDLIKIVTVVGSIVLFATEISKKIDLLTLQFIEATKLHNTVHETINARLKRLEDAEDKRNENSQYTWDHKLVKGAK